MRPCAAGHRAGLLPWLDAGVLSSHRTRVCRVEATVAVPGHALEAGPGKLHSSSGNLHVRLVRLCPCATPSLLVPPERKNEERKHRERHSLLEAGIMKRCGSLPGVIGLLVILVWSPDAEAHTKGLT